MTEIITYKQEGDYLIPDLKLPEENEPVGKYGRMRETFLKQNRSSIYTTLLLTGKLHEHLTEIDRTAKEQIEQMPHLKKLMELIRENSKILKPQILIDPLAGIRWYVTGTANAICFVG